MRNRGNVFGGAILVVLGIIFLGVSNDWFDIDFSMRELAKYWPVMIILAGVAVLFNERKTIYNPTTALLVAFAIPMGIYHASNKAIDEFKDDVNEDLNFEWNDDSDDDDSYSSSSDSSSRGNFEQNFQVDYNSAVKEARLEIGGGAAEFHLDEADAAHVFQADTKIFGNSFKLEDEVKDDVHEINFNMRSKNNSSIKMAKGKGNDVYLKLNKKPIWDLELKIGAGNLDFDLSDYKVKNLEVKTGAAEIDLKVGSLVKETAIDVESGVAKIKIKVPKSSACEIVLDGALNAKDFNGFDKQSSGRYKSDNFDTATNKITIKIKSGLSAVTVDRY